MFELPNGTYDIVEAVPMIDVHRSCSGMELFFLSGPRPNLHDQVPSLCTHACTELASSFPASKGSNPTSFPNSLDRALHAERILLSSQHVASERYFVVSLNDGI